MHDPTDMEDAVELHVAVDPLVDETDEVIRKLEDFCKQQDYPVIRCFYRNLEWEEVESLEEE